MQVVFLIMLFTIGACLGSFLCCQARRLHLRTTKTKSKNFFGRRSICLHCHRQLKWYDNLPIVSWLLLGGKCRHCHHRIGCAEILSELGLGLSFLCLGTTVNISDGSILIWTNFIIILTFMTIIGFLAIYDGIYGELPSIILYLSIVLAALSLTTQELLLLSVAPFSNLSLLNPVLSVLILGGTYLVLYLVSKGKWVGDGDWLLATAIAIALSHPWLAINALFVANLTACLVMLPLVKKQKTRRIHLGPFLVVGFVVTYSLSSFFLQLIGV